MKATSLLFLPCSGFVVVHAFSPSGWMLKRKNLYPSTTARFDNEPALFIDETHNSVSEYYGKTLSTSDDLKTNACCTAGAPPQHIQDCLSNIHDTVKSKYYGCGLTIPDEMDGCTVLDLGCGAGRDVYIASQLVGPKGRVIGVDMTPEQLQVATDYQDYHAERFGYSNTEFYKGFLEQLDELPLEDNSVDIIISNCVINLCADKESVLKSCKRLLKPGGELYFSDVYASRRVPQTLKDNEVLWGECLSGALYWNDFEQLSKKVGFADPRLVEDAPITINNDEMKRVIHEAGQGQLEFYSATYRLYNLDQLEYDCEDYGQAVIYKGTIPRHPSTWYLDKHHCIEANRIFPVCGNTYHMLKNTRFEPHFDFVGNFDTHFGPFEGCGAKGLPFTQITTTNDQTKGACC